VLVLVLELVLGAIDVKARGEGIVGNGEPNRIGVGNVCVE
jgi:hypothetical protein